MPAEPSVFLDTNPKQPVVKPSSTATLVQEAIYSKLDGMR